MPLSYEDLEGRWLAVDSTCASHAYVYGPDLLVRFRDSGHVYVYDGAGKEVFALLKASSVGVFINEVVKKNYHGELLRNPPPLPRSGAARREERY
jgi:hypothetical protein